MCMGGERCTGIWGIGAQKTGVDQKQMGIISLQVGVMRRVNCKDGKRMKDGSLTHISIMGKDGWTRTLFGQD